MRRTPTIYEALRTKLGREPTLAELRAEVHRIIAEGTAAANARASKRLQRASKRK
jgi:hypothetical protein